uniref:Ras association domain family member 2 n=1 Tax=Catagonus wagneri TaxID=51154 RepID=A0A8C3W748_9CETA
MDYSHQTSLVPCGQDKYISKNELLLHLKTYNLYYEGQNLQLRHREVRFVRLLPWWPAQALAPCPLGLKVPASPAGSGFSMLVILLGVPSFLEGDPGPNLVLKRMRFSTSVFTPAYGSITNVRINSTMTTPQVLKLLLNKFKIENSAEEFALYVVHTSGEKQKLKNTDYPLIARILQGPCEQVSKVFLMEKDQVEEVTYDVAQYIKFEMPVLKSFIQKLQEEEDREVKKLMRKYTVLRLMIRQRLEEIAETPATI